MNRRGFVAGLATVFGAFTSTAAASVSILRPEPIPTVVQKIATLARLAPRYAAIVEPLIDRFLEINARNREVDAAMKRGLA